MGYSDIWLHILEPVFNSFSPSKFTNIYLLLTTSIKNKVFCCENVEIDHTTVHKLSNMKKNSFKLFKTKVWIPFSREDKAKFEFTWNGMEIGSIDRSQFLINFAV